MLASRPVSVDVPGTTGSRKVGSSPRSFDDAREDVIDELEKAAFHRAKDGSDGLLIFLLKGLRPGVYRDALKIDTVSPIVKEKLAQTVHIIRRQLTKWLADPLLEKRTTCDNSG